MDTSDILTAAAVAAALLALWFAWKVVKKVIFWGLVALVVVGLGLFVYLRFLQ